MKSYLVVGLILLFASICHAQGNPVVVTSQALGNVNYFAYEVITVAATSTSLTAGTYLDANVAYCTLETAQVRFRLDAGAPTDTVGHLFETGQSILLVGNQQIKDFRAYRTTGTSGSLRCSYAR